MAVHKTIKRGNCNPTSGAEVMQLVQAPYSSSTYGISFQVTCLGVDRDDTSNSVSFFSSRGGGLESGVASLHTGFGGLQKSVALDAANVVLAVADGFLTLTVTGVSGRNIDWAGDVSLLTIEPSP